MEWNLLIWGLFVFVLVPSSITELCGSDPPEISHAIFRAFAYKNGTKLNCGCKKGFRRIGAYTLCSGRSSWENKCQCRSSQTCCRHCPPAYTRICKGQCRARCEQAPAKGGLCLARLCNPSAQTLPGTTRALEGCPELTLEKQENKLPRILQSRKNGKPQKCKAECSPSTKQTSRPLTLSWVLPSTVLDDNQLPLNDVPPYCSGHCLEPPPWEHEDTKRIYHFVVGQTVHYQCIQGYKALQKGPFVSVCRTVCGRAMWTQPQLTCVGESEHHPFTGEQAHASTDALPDSETSCPITVTEFQQHLEATTTMESSIFTVEYQVAVAGCVFLLISILLLSALLWQHLRWKKSRRTI